MFEIKIGEVYKNHAGEFTKVTDYKNGFVYTNGWHFKAETAETTEGGNGANIVNDMGFERAVLGEVEVMRVVNNGVAEDVEVAKPEATTAPEDVVKATKGKGK